MRKKKALLCIAETIAVNIVIYEVFFVLQPNQDIYLQLNPHPLFLLSIVMGMRYGNYLGTASATVSSLFFIKVFLTLHGSFLSLFSYFQNYKYILLFFLAAMVFGFFKDNHAHVMEKISREKEMLEDSYKQLLRTYKLTQKVQEELKKQIIGSEESIIHLYEIASRLETLDSEEIYTETIGILLKYLKADAVSIYTFDESSGYLRLKIKTGDGNLSNRSLLVKDSPGLSKAAYDKQVVRWSDVGEDNFPLMSAPLIKDDKVLAVVNILHMEFDRLSEYAFQLFKLIIDWVNKALDRAIYVDGLTGTKYIPGTRVLPYELFQQRLKEEARRKTEFGMDYVLLKYRVQEVGPVIIDERVRKRLRSVDVVGYDDKQKVLYILLPATTKENIPVVEERIINGFGYPLEKISAGVPA